MNNVQKWVDALRSGEYKQDKYGLKTELGFCCLGVLCDLYHKETGKGEWVRKSGQFSDLHLGNDILSTRPSGEILEWLGSPAYIKTVQYIPNNVSVLMGMNDNKDASFAEIADHIELTHAQATETTNAE